MELIKAPLAVMVPERIDLLKIEIEQMSVKYFAIKSSEIKVFASPDLVTFLIPRHPLTPSTA